MHSIHKPFHQKYRPKNLDELVGQEFISTTLKQALLSNKIAPAYLFKGPRGTGKTSSARIFAKSLNCLSSEHLTSNPCGNCEICKQINNGNALDIIEIDAASNTGVENIREIIERARFAPSQARWKVYVIDECHMLSTAASNALLKTIEEPPSRVVFILATTNPERVLTTIQSRCQKFDFKRISSIEIFQQLSLIADKEKIKYEEQALKIIAKRSNGGMRDAQSLLEQLSLLPSGITTKNVQNILGEVSEIDLVNLINSLVEDNPEKLLVSCNKLYDLSYEPQQIIVGLLNITRDLLLTLVGSPYSEIYYTTSDFQSKLNKLAENLDKSKIIDWHNKLKNVEYQIKTSDNPRLWLEINLTSLLEKSQKNNNTTYQLSQKQASQDKSYKEQSNLENIKNKKTLDKLQIRDKNNDESKSENMNNLEEVNKKNIELNLQNDKNHSDLKDKWELILSKLELPSTRMLLSQQAELESISHDSIVIALSANWENMIKSRKLVIEDVVKKIFGEQVQVKFSNKQVNKNNTKKLEKELDPKNIYPNPTETTEIKNPNLPKESPKKEEYENSTKNLANFFNGEIIELEE